MAEESKYFLGSTTILGATLAGIPSLLEGLHNLVSDIVSSPEIIPILPPHVAPWVAALGVVLAAIGRKKAKKPIRFKLKKAN